jgi:hypothetical protein
LLNPFLLYLIYRIKPGCFQAVFGFGLKLVAKCPNFIVTLAAFIRLKFHDSGSAAAAMSVFFLSLTISSMWFLLLGLIAATVIMALETARRVRNLVTPSPVAAR